MSVDEAVRNAHAWFEVNSGWAPPDDDTVAEWVADGVCRCPDECLVAPLEWCRHGLASWYLILAALAEDDVAAALAAYRLAEVRPDDADAAVHLDACTARVTGRGQAALDVLTLTLAHDDSTLRGGAAYVLGCLGKADAAFAPVVRASLIAAAHDEIDDSVIWAITIATSLAGLGLDEALGLMRLGPTMRRIGVYHLAMVASAAAEDEPVRDALAAAGDDPDPVVRWWAQFGLDTSGGSDTSGGDTAGGAM